MRILITGSRGFVGGSFGRSAAREGHTLLGLGRDSQPALDWPGDYAQADVVSADLSGYIQDFAPDAVFHAAGTASVGASLSSPVEDLRASALTWANTLDAVRRSGLRPLVLFPSSAAVYGNPEVLPVKEDAPLRPVSPYGFHKAVCELLGREYAECFGLSVIVCRLFSLFGAAQRRLLVWELYSQLIGREQTVWLQGTGTESRDYLHVDDLSAALLQLIALRREGQEREGVEQAKKSDVEETASSERERGSYLIVNVASGVETGVLNLAERLREIIAPHKTIRGRGLERRSDPHHWRADVSLLRSLIPGWQPQTLVEGLEQCIAKWRSEAGLATHGV